MARPIETKFGVFRDQAPDAYCNTQVFAYCNASSLERAPLFAYFGKFAYAQMCSLFGISETAGRIALKFDMWLETR